MTYIIDLHRLWEGTDLPSKKRRKNEPKSATIAHLVSAIVVAKGDETALIDTLHSLVQQQAIREVIVINETSSSSLKIRLDEFATRYPRCFIVPGEQAMGLSQAYNLGARYACAQYLLFVDPTHGLPQHALRELLATGISKPQPWIVGITHSQRDRHLFQKMTHFYSRDHHHSQTMPEVSLAGGGFHVSNINSECMLMPTRTFLDLKGIDSKCSPEMLGMDLCFRLHLAGGSVYSVKDLEFTTQQEKPHSIVKLLAQEWLTFKGRCYFYRKHVSQKTNLLLKSAHLGWLGLQFVANCACAVLSFPLAFKRVS